MRALVTIALLALCACVQDQPRRLGDDDVMLQTVAHDGCEYILVTRPNRASAPAIIHKGNCSNIIHKPF